MIVSRLRGGLGNQLFGYATGRALAIRHGVELELDLDEYDVPPCRDFELDHLRTRYKRFRARSSIRRMFSRKLKLIEEVGYQYVESVLEAPDFTRLQGFWQSEKYFKHIRSQLLEELSPKSEAEDRNAETLKAIREKPSVSMHIRRTDYLMPHVLKLHGVMPLEYYRHAFEIVRAKNPDVRVFVFSDDIAWARENLRLGAQTEFIDWNLDRCTEDLRLMSFCNHNIIANSTFSWWGAWLNPRPDRIVVAPKKWFQDPSVDSAHVLPDSWIKI